MISLLSYKTKRVVPLSESQADAAAAADADAGAKEWRRGNTTLALFDDDSSDDDAPARRKREAAPTPDAAPAQAAPAQVAPAQAAPSPRSPRATESPASAAFRSLRDSGTFAPGLAAPAPPTPPAPAAAQPVPSAEHKADADDLCMEDIDDHSTPGCDDLVDGTHGGTSRSPAHEATTDGDAAATDGAPTAANAATEGKKASRAFFKNIFGKGPAAPAAAVKLRAVAPAHAAPLPKAEPPKKAVALVSPRAAAAPRVSPRTAKKSAAQSAKPIIVEPRGSRGSIRSLATPAAVPGDAAAAPGEDGDAATADVATADAAATDADAADASAAEASPRTAYATAEQRFRLLQGSK
ncbi:hypothetical protein M885DRAFT_521292 [Pelagophyceae sp. CCMP2097]|nr:hypothetical protein M885DRAFT_521292 [Pelagophyceae sp. CCMP2097]